MYTYLEIKRYDTGFVVTRMNLTGKNRIYIDKVDNGININLNHEQYYTVILESEENLATGNFKPENQLT